MAVPAVTEVTTRKGITAKVRVDGPADGPQLVWFHGAGGLFPTEPTLDALATTFRVHAAEWPGFGEEPTEGLVEDMLDFTLHGWDLVDALGLTGARPHLAGHSMGGMIAAEMAALNPTGLDRLVLVASVGLWLDSQPIPDIFAMLPFELAETLFADAKAGEAALTAGLDFSDDMALKVFLFPIPNRRLSKRLYRVTNPTLLLWGSEDRLVPPVYAERFAELMTATTAEVRLIEGAAHMLPYEHPAEAAAAITTFLTS
jgi:pimeloyl-ACP methyl ester carboxylesterase